MIVHVTVSLTGARMSPLTADPSTSTSPVVVVSAGRSSSSAGVPLPESDQEPVPSAFLASTCTW